MLRECPHTPEMVVVIRRSALADKCKQAEQKEEKSTSNAAGEDKAEVATEEDKAEVATEEDKADEATVEVAKAISECGGKCVKKNSHSIKPEQSKNPAKKKKQ